MTSQRRAARRTTSQRRPAALSLADSRLPRRPDTAETGENSVSYLAGSGRLRRLLDTEYLWELRGTSAMAVFDRMRMSDPKIAGLRFAQNLPLLRAPVFVEPADPGDKDAVAKAELVERLLIDDFPWRAFLADTTLCSDYGFACFEVVWRIEENEARCRLAYRPAASIWPEDVYIEDGKIAKVVQHPAFGPECEIPGERVLWFAHGKEGDDFRGRAILRPMYKPWKLKQEIEVQLAVLIGKMGGVPVFRTQPGIDDETAALLDEAGESFGIAAGAFLRTSDEVDVQLLASNAKVGEVLDAIRYWDEQLTAVCQAQVLDLGVTQTGSRALGTTLADMFSDSIEAQANYREDVLNARGGLVHQLVAYNFPRDDNLPSLRFGSVQRADLRAMAQAFLWLSQAGMPLGEETWEWLRGELNMPEDDAAQVVVPPSAPAAPQPAPAPQQPPDDGPGEEGLKEGAQAAECGCGAHSIALSEPNRAPRGVEVYMNLAELSARFDTARTAVADATAQTREALVRELVRRAMAAADKGTLERFAAGSPPMVDALTADVARVLGTFYAAGRQQVADELQRQREGMPFAVRAADAPPEMPPPEADLLAALRVQAAAIARSIATSLQAFAALIAGRRVAGTPLPEAQVLDLVGRESQAAALRYTAASDFMSMGRAAEAQAQAQDVEDAVYSAILDGNTCPSCEAMDGDVTNDLAEAAAWTPNPLCAGGGNCRCLAVYELRQA